MSTDGGDIYGAVFQAGGDVIVGIGTPTSPAPTYGPKWTWRSPLTMAVLTWLSLFVGVIGTAAVWKALQPVVEWLMDRGRDAIPSPNVMWFYTFVLAVILTAALLSLRRLTKHRTQQFLPVAWLPVLTGWGGRIGLARFKGDCPLCGGPLKFYDKPVKWERGTDGKLRVARRQMAAECRRNADHWWAVDKTDINYPD